MANKKREKPVIRVTVGIDQSDYYQLSRIPNSSSISLALMIWRSAHEFIERLENKSNVVMTLSPA